MKAKLYKPNAVTILAMAAGGGVFLFLKVRRSGWEVAGVVDAVLYALALSGVVMLAAALRGWVRVDDEAVEIAGLLSRGRYPLAEIVSVTTEKGAPVTIALRDGRVIGLPLWMGTEGWAVAAAIRARLRAAAPAAPATRTIAPPAGRGGASA